MHRYLRADDEAAFFLSPDWKRSGCGHLSLGIGCVMTVSSRETLPTKDGVVKGNGHRLIGEAPQDR
jgi:hypothetical protein